MRLHTSALYAHIGPRNSDKKSVVGVAKTAAPTVAVTFRNGGTEDVTVDCFSAAEFGDAAAAQNMVLPDATSAANLTLPPGGVVTVLVSTLNGFLFFGSATDNEDLTLCAMASTGAVAMLDTVDDFDITGYTA